mmetsp:Transcript_8629/g.22252  ORF Transcript_8629/g.22252 Transcript_8629/m.22252 type:complete len:106 (-) Transcript_8629:281-598(-)
MLRPARVVFPQSVQHGKLRRLREEVQGTVSLSALKGVDGCLGTVVAVVTSKKAALLYLGTFLMILTAQYSFLMRSQHSTTLPNVPSPSLLKILYLLVKFSPTTKT